MPNPGNVTNYGKLVHEAAEHGGPEKYLEEFANANYQRGKHDGLMNYWWIGPAIIGGYELVKRLGKRAYRWFKYDRHERKRRIEASERYYREKLEEMIRNDSIGEEKLPEST